MKSGKSAKAPQKRNADATRAKILQAALTEFSERGLPEASTDAIAERCGVNKRMIYYYFGSKEGLYLAVLEKAYGDIRALEANLELEALDPVEALRRLIELTFDYDDSHTEFVRLVTIENIHQAKHLSEASSIRRINLRVIELIGAILDRGRAMGRFRADLEPVDVHMMISSFCFFRVANRHTFGKIFRIDLSDPERRARHKAMICDAVIRLLDKA